MNVKDVYDMLFVNTLCKVVGYYSGADYGMVRTELFDEKVKCISADVVNGSEPCICIMIDR